MSRGGALSYCGGCSPCCRLLRVEKYGSAADLGGLLGGGLLLVPSFRARRCLEPPLAYVLWV